MDSLEQKRRSVESSREELKASVDQLGDVAEQRRGELVRRAKTVAVPTAAAVAGVAVAAFLMRRRRRRRGPLVEFGPFAVHTRH